MTEHVTTCGELVDGLGTKTRADRIMMIVSDKPYWSHYNTHHRAIDNMLKRYYSDFVLPDISNLAEATSDPTDPVYDELAFLASYTLDALDTALSRLWELESVTFNPIENYDRIEEWSDTRNGEQCNTRTETTTTSGTNKSDAYSDTTTISNGKRDSTVTEKQGATNTSSEVTSENTSQTNQTSTTTNKGTSYNTNLVDTTTLTMTGSPDVTTEKATTTTTSDAVTNTVATSQNAVSDVTSFDAGGRSININNKVTGDYTDTMKYNDVVDRHTGRVHGNIGVTTSTAMMEEYVGFYERYSFWKKFWDMFIGVNASCIFETDRSYY